MALNGDILGAAIKAAIDAEADKTDRDAVFRALGNAIVQHIQTFAQVTVAVTTTGSATNQAGPGTGTVL
jgi:hypothetical protein